MIVKTLTQYESRVYDTCIMRDRAYPAEVEVLTRTSAPQARAIATVQQTDGVGSAVFGLIILGLLVSVLIGGT